ncbi:mRNA splicing factor [Phaffia rhodozyma]|uniref:mRNA splicing factor n=1 Tax=Phaffia rhodozyma TaxID=264483 RepID=A0A0F7SEK6_PHARH|nr:mRNA splicing factor [Phaffia rhodozyma]
MARNEEKSQSMLYRFREAQQVELGFARPKGGRRPRLASSVDNLKDCERYRGEILREISRKVSKIQDAGLTDYEIRDLNDEINKLMREKGHYERQIVSLGGANYKRSTAMVDEDGKEVPGTRGYKYFGRAKELPGVKELFSKKAVAETDESQRAELFRRYRNQGPEYYGDLDETDGTVLDAEREREESDWIAGFERVSNLLGASTESIPPFPRITPVQPSSSTAATTTAPTTGPSKRSAEEDDGQAQAVSEEEPTEDESSKKLKLTDPDSESPTDTSASLMHGTSANTTGAAGVGFIGIGILNQKDLERPTLLTKSQMDKVLLDRRKQILLDQYMTK